MEVHFILPLHKWLVYWNHHAHPIISALNGWTDFKYFKFGVWIYVDGLHIVSDFCCWQIWTSCFVGIWHFIWYGMVVNIWGTIISVLTGWVDPINFGFCLISIFYVSGLMHTQHKSSCNFMYCFVKTETWYNCTNQLLFSIWY